GHIVELPDGGLLLPLHGTLSREWLSQAGETPRCFVLRSDDRGRNWEYWATVAYDPANILDWVEPGLTRLRDGRLGCLTRPRARPGPFDNLWSTESEDDGASWSRPVRTGLWGYPADVLQLDDSRVLAAYGYPRAPRGRRRVAS